MKKQTFNRIKKTLGVLLLVSLIMFVTSAAASAENVNVSPRDGYEDGYKDGSKVGYEDCLKHGKQGVLTKISTPPNIKDKDDIEKYKQGYVNGYNTNRFKCVQNR
jgi:hypothetical protein